MKKIIPLPNNIQALLDEKDMSARQLAKKINLSPPQFGRVIKGETPLTAKWIFKIAEALNVKAIDVVGLKLIKATLKKYDPALLGSIMGYLIEEANDRKVPLNINELSKLTSYICEETVERQLNDFATRRLAIDAIQIKEMVTD